MSQSNGKALIEIESLQPIVNADAVVIPQEESPAPVKKKGNYKGGANNKAIEFRLDIDAGAKRIKCRLNGKCKSYPAEAKEIKSEVPLRNDGCFSYRKKNYVVGSAIDRVNGNLILSSQDNKLSHLDVWILGSLTHFRPQLKAAVESRRRRTAPVQINLFLRVVTLSSPQRKELEKSLKAIQNFTWEDTEFNLNVKRCEFVDEGEGSALEVINTYKQKRFHLLDLGGGTVTYTTYEYEDGELSTIAKSPVSGGGMVAIHNRIFKALTRTDRGANQAEIIDIQQSLELAKVTESGYECPLRINGKSINIADEVEAALSEWVRLNYSVSKLFDTVSQYLAKGESVYCTGGGFACKVVADWVLKYLCDGVESPKIKILDNPQEINLAGLHWLDKTAEE